MSQSILRCKKSAQDATTVTLVPATEGAGAQNYGQAGITSVVVTCGDAVPAGFWGATLAAGPEFELILRRRS